MENISITQTEYQELKNDARILRALEHAGVDNWEGYDIAMDLLEVMKPKECHVCKIKPSVKHSVCPAPQEEEVKSEVIKQ